MNYEIRREVCIAYYANAYVNFGKYIAHRGLYNNEIPENSISAFKNAVDKGFSVELDIRLTKDCKMVVFHDSNLKRMCGVDAEISDFTYEQLKAFSLGNSDEKIPLLSDVLKVIDGKVPVLAELKGGYAFWELEKRVYHILKQYNGDYAVESFNPLSMLWFRIFAPEIKRGQLISEFKNKLDKNYILRKISSKPFIWKLISKPDFVAADLRSISMEQLFASLDMGADFITWTANSDELIDAAEQFSKTVIIENTESMSHDFSDNWKSEEESVED